MSALVYLFYPNPANANYSSPKAIALMVLCALFIAASFGIKAWRRKTQDGKLRQLSKTWSAAALWFGIVGLVLVIARVEQIQYVAMRFWWLVWLLALGLYAFLQFKLYKARYYSVLPTAVVKDPRDRYLPGKKKK